MGSPEAAAPDLEQIRRDADELARRVPGISEAAVGSRTLYLVAAVTAHAKNLLMREAEMAVAAEEALRLTVDLRQEVGRVVADRNGLRSALRLGTPFPAHEVLRILAGAVDHLEDAHDCDADGWEIRRRARDAAREIAARLETPEVPGA